MNGRLLSAGLQLVVLFTGLLVSPTALAFSPQERKLGGIVEGLSLGDVDGDGRLETAVVLRSGFWNPNEESDSSQGSLVLLDSSGNPLWEKKTGKNLAGHATVADFDGDGRDEVAFCEMHSKGVCRVVDGNGSVLWTSPELYFPAMSGTAPAAADLNGDGVDDLVVSSWGGTILSMNGRNGQPLWRYEGYGELEELFCFNPTLVDLDQDGIEDVVALGSNHGYVLALSGSSGALLWHSEPLMDRYENRSLGNGALATQLVPGGPRELVITLTGKESAVFGFSHAGKQLFRTPVPGYLDYMSAVAADADGDRVREVFVQSGNGLLFELGNSGSLLRSVSIGQQSWVPPAFIDTDHDGVVEVLAVAKDSLSILKGASLKEIDHYDHGFGGLQPSPVVADRNRDGQVEFLIGSWYGSDLMVATMASPSPHLWATIGGNVQHQGEHALSGLGAITGGIVAELASARDQFATQDGKRYEAAAEDVEDALSAHLSGAPRVALRKIRHALGELAHVSGSAAQAERQALGELALRMAHDHLARTQALAGATDDSVSTGLSWYQQAMSQSADQIWEDVLLSLEKASHSVRRVSLDAGGHCDELVPSEQFLTLQCEFLEVLGKLPAEASLERSTIALGLAPYARLGLPAALSLIATGLSLLEQDTEELAQLVAITGKMSRFYLDEARLGFEDDARLEKAEGYWTKGRDLEKEGKFVLATANYTAATAALRF